MWGPFPYQGQADLFKKPTFPLAQSSIPALPISLRAPLDKARRSLRAMGGWAFRATPVARWLPFGYANTATTSAMSV
jgi:hypothetical protein